MQTLKRLFGLGRLMAAGLIAVVTLTIMAHAVQTVITPNGLLVTYSLAPGANSAGVTPAAGTPVLVMGVQNAVGFRGVGEVTMLHVQSNFLEWVGLESPFSAAITSGFSSTPGTHIVFLDFSHLVDIQVKTADSFMIHNANTSPMNGKVTLIW